MILINQLCQSKFNLYRTAAGYRLLILHKLFNPTDQQIWALLSELGIDPIYHRMCRLQKCFRARLTPKPWRMKGMLNTIPIGRRVWRSEFIKNPERVAWVAEYEQTSADYAVCALIKQYGNHNTSLDPKIQAVLDLHDKYTKVGQALPLA